MTQFAHPGPISSRPDLRRGRGKSKAEQGAETRAHLIAVARLLFGERGYAGTSTKRLLDESGVTRGALYHHFRDKADLMRAVCDDVYSAVSRRIESRASCADTSWDALRIGCEAFLDIVPDRAIVQILFIDGPSVLGWESWDAIEREHGFASLVAGLTSAVEQGDLAVQPVEPVAVLLNGALNNSVYWASQQPDRREAVRAVQTAFNRLLSGLRVSESEDIR